MRIKVFIILIIILLTNCSVKKNIPIVNWEVEKIRTNYMQKGKMDTYQLPKDLIGSHALVKNNLLILSKNKEKYSGLIFNDEFGDTIYFERITKFVKIKDDDVSLVYPGDEFTECIQQENDTCLISENFLNLLECEKNSIEGYVSKSGKHSKSKLILFFVKENRRLVLYSENDFLMLFLKPR